MARSCTVCTHPASTEIDAALLDGESSYSVGAAYGLNRQAIARHRRDHLLTGMRPVPPASGEPTTLPAKSHHRRPALSQKSAMALVETIKIDAIRTPQLPAPVGEVEQMVEDAPGSLVKKSQTTGTFEGMSQATVIRMLIGELILLGRHSRDKNDTITAVVAFKEAGNLAAKFMKLSPDRGEPTSESDDDQAKLKALILQVTTIQPWPSPDWKVS